MKNSVKLPYVHYGQEEAAELERASIRVQHIYDKTQDLLDRYMPDSMWTAMTGMSRNLKEPELWEGDLESGIFQKWVKSPKGWKCIGCERYSHPSVISETPTQAEGESSFEAGDGAGRTFHDKGLPGRLLQMVIWSQFEEIRLFQPFLGDEPFFTEEEMEVISDYFVPTYISPVPLKERGKDFKTIQTGIPLYQERISAPSLVMQSEGASVSGNWMTGVDLSSRGFSGLRPYLKIPKGGRTYMKALIV
ncbi:hypothetical protein MNQ98_10185 [Paenibacillus sp. N3/727]|uniref:hypothetical protein n=1 Tax=Paenibacillus sp. N3/727 TaxID=2925845 RepID=UPI001F5377E8|nr:hypothetical protein [Paenibacillus sp. N3/727]UNK20347.1 hypothetical protein MNQ98_10185 [Paenibacillus sp. N3/727]